MPRGQAGKYRSVRVGVRLPKFLIENVKQYQDESELDTFSDALRELITFGLIFIRARGTHLIQVEGMKELLIHKPTEPQKAERT